MPGPLPVVLWPLPLPGVSGDRDPAVMSPFRQPRLMALPSGQNNDAVFLSSWKASFQSKIKCPRPHSLRVLLKCLSPPAVPSVGVHSSSRRCCQVWLGHRLQINLLPVDKTPGAVPARALRLRLCPSARHLVPVYSFCSRG